MKYMAGYQLQPSGALMNAILQHKEHIHEVYFSWGRMPSGRGASAVRSELPAHQALQKQQEELQRLSQNGVSLNLLLNANCWGASSLSRAFLMETGDLISWMQDVFRLTSVTSTSPVLAHFIKRNFPQLEVRASVNMEIGTIEGMEYIAEDFDSFYAKRELNRDLHQLARMKEWCAAHGKQLYMLANSGCLNFCSARTFHDNLVAHEQEIAKMDNGVSFHSACSRYLEKEENRAALLAHLNCVRPEEISLYEPYVTAAKLATRVSPRPEAILNAYVKGSYSGNLLDLTEPSHAAHFPFVDNALLPPDFCRHTASCDKRCPTCSYCINALKGASVSFD